MQGVGRHGRAHYRSRSARLSRPRSRANDWRPASSGFDGKVVIWSIVCSKNSDNFMEQPPGAVVRAASAEGEHARHHATGKLGVDDANMRREGRRRGQRRHPRCRSSKHLQPHGRGDRHVAGRSRCADCSGSHRCVRATREGHCDGEWDAAHTTGFCAAARWSPRPLNSSAATSKAPTRPPSGHSWWK